MTDGSTSVEAKSVDGCVRLPVEQERREHQQQPRSAERVLPASTHAASGPAISAPRRSTLPPTARRDQVGAGERERVQQRADPQERVAVRLLGSDQRGEDEHRRRAPGRRRGDERLRAAFGEHQREQRDRRERRERKHERPAARRSGERPGEERQREERPCDGARERGDNAQHERQRAGARAGRAAAAPRPIARPRSNGTRLDSSATEAPSANQSDATRVALRGEAPVDHRCEQRRGERSSRSPPAAAGRSARRAPARAASRRAGGGRRTRSCPTA